MFSTGNRQALWIILFCPYVVAVCLEYYKIFFYALHYFFKNFNLTLVAENFILFLFSFFCIYPFNDETICIN